MRCYIVSTVLYLNGSIVDPVKVIMGLEHTLSKCLRAKWPMLSMRHKSIYIQNDVGSFFAPFQNEIMLDHLTTLSKLAMIIGSVVNDMKMMWWLFPTLSRWCGIIGPLFENMCGLMSTLSKRSEVAWYILPTLWKWCGGFRPMNYHPI